MARFIPLIWGVLLLGVAGCANRSSPTGGDQVQALLTVQPPTGGEMVLIPAGTFTMGDSAGRPDETPHSVSLGAFYVDKAPVTQEIFEKIVGVNPSKRKEKRNPVERTQWTDAVRFCNKCSELEGLTPCYDLTTWQCNFQANGYRLPTEAEWEYACRAGGTTRFGCGDTETELVQFAWFKPHSQGKPHPVGGKRPNRWGLYDMHGNVWQWCNDWYGETYYAESPREIPHGPAAGKMRVLRGGAWDSTAEKCRSAYRHKEFPVFADACFGADSYGFRRVRNGVAAESVQVVARPPVDPNRGTKVEKAPVKAPAPVTGTSKIDPARLKGTIVFVSDRGGSLKVWSMNANGSAARQLTKGTDADADPRFSPDGKRIAYTTLRKGFPQVWTMNRDGSNPRMVTQGSQASWAPDGKSLVFIRDNQAHVRDLVSGQEKLVTPKNWERCGVPAFSPDGKRIAVASRHLGNIGIFLLGLDGKENRALPTEEGCCTPQWSRDGKRMLCQTVRGHIHQVAVEGKDWEQLTFGADLQHDGRYSPDGTMLLFCRAPSADGPWQICLKKLDADDDDSLTLTKEGSNLLPDWHEGD